MFRLWFTKRWGTTHPARQPKVNLFVTQKNCQNTRFYYSHAAIWQFFSRSMKRRSELFGSLEGAFIALTLALLWKQGTERVKFVSVTLVSSKFCSVFKISKETKNCTKHVRIFFLNFNDLKGGMKFFTEKNSLELSFLSSSIVSTWEVRYTLIF